MSPSAFGFFTSSETLLLFSNASTTLLQARLLLFSRRSISNSLLYLNISSCRINTGVFSGCPYYISDSYQRHIPSLCQLRNNFFSKISHKAQYYQLTLKISTKKEPLISQKSQILRFYVYSISPNCTILA